MTLAKLLSLWHVLPSTVPAAHKPLLKLEVLAYSKPNILLKDHYIGTEPWQVQDRRTAWLELMDSRAASALGWTVCGAFGMMEGVAKGWTLYGYDNRISPNLTVFLYDSPEGLRVLMLGKCHITTADRNLRGLDPEDLCRKLGVGVERLININKGPQALGRLDHPDVRVVASDSARDGILDKYRRMALEEL